MAKDPALLWYPSDYLTGTMEYSFEEKGAYMEVLMMEFKHGGPLPDEKVKRILKEKYAAIWSVIGEKFKRNEKGEWYNERLEEERSKRKSFTDSRRKNREGKTQEKLVNNTSDSLVKLVENVNEDENVNGFKYQFKESEQKVTDLIFSDELYIEKLRSTHRDKDLRQAFKECYMHHSNAPNPPKELWQWRQKLNTWLTIKPPENKQQTPTKKFSKEEAKAKRNGNV